MLDTLRSKRFVDRSPEQVYPILLDEGVYLCSPSTMYRLLTANAEIKERRAQATHPAKKKPELLATRPNQVWSWDVTKLKGPKRGEYFDLLVAIDIYSRYIVGWMLVNQSNEEVAKAFLGALIKRYDIEPNTLTIHADRGSEMTAKGTAQLLTDLNVDRSHSRPHVSNDNPYSEAGFKTLKYFSGFPDRFGCIEDARAYCSWFFDEYYNHEHRHSGIGYYTPASIHFGAAEAMRCQRATTLDAAYAAHPERFVKQPPKPTELPAAAWINCEDVHRAVAA